MAILSWMVCNGPASWVGWGGKTYQTPLLINVEMTYSAEALYCFLTERLGWAGSSRSAMAMSCARCPWMFSARMLLASGCVAAASGKAHVRQRHRAGHVSLRDSMCTPKPPCESVARRIPDSETPRVTATVMVSADTITITIVIAVRRRREFLASASLTSLPAHVARAWSTC